MDFELNDDQQAYIASARAFSDNELAPHAAQWDAESVFAKEALRAAGATELMIESPLSVGGWHLMGTARMGRDSQNSVVNEWGRTHDVRNLFVIDGSIFVTSAGVNPTRTIQTLALYITDQIKKRLANLFD